MVAGKPRGRSLRRAVPHGIHDVPRSSIPTRSHSTTPGRTEACRLRRRGVDQPGVEGPRGEVRTSHGEVAAGRAVNYPGAVSDFRAAVEARDPDAMAAALADNVVFRSPVAFKPYPGKVITAAILRGVLRVFEDFRYVREMSGNGGRDHALVFEARIGDVAVEGCDLLHLDDNGLIDEFTVMVRPLSAAQALATAMAAQFEQIQREAVAG